MASLTRLVERLFCACEPSVWIAKEPQRQRPKIVGESRRQQPMFDRIVKRNRLIVVREGFREVAREHQYKGDAALRHHEHDFVSLFLGKRQDLRATLARQVAVECGSVRYPYTAESPKQKKWILGRLPERFSLFDQQ